MNHYIDVRGIDPIQSWKRTRAYLGCADDNGIITITDNIETADYIKRMAESNGVPTCLEEMGGEFYLHFTKQTKLLSHENLYTPSKLVVVITGDTLGNGDETLGKVLLKTYIYQMQFINPLPECIIFINKGIFLVVEGSDVLDSLRCLNERGVKILTSATCLGYYNKKNELSVGDTAEMNEITKKMNKSERTIII